MDYRNIYQVILDILESKNDSKFSNVLKDMKVASPDGSKAANNKLIHDLFLSTGKDIVESEFGYSTVAKFIKDESISYPELNDLIIDKSDYINRCLDKESSTAYYLLYWTFKMFSMLYKPDRYLDELVTTFKPILDDHGKEIMNPWLYHFMDGYRTYFFKEFEKGPAANNDGYNYAASWLFGASHMTQTIMLRFGLSYWKSVYPHFEWFSPRNDDKFEVNPNFLAKTLAYKDGKEIKEFLPIFISFGHQITFNYKNHLYSIKFLYSDVDQDDIVLMMDGKEYKRFDFLDDFIKDKSIDGHGIMDVFDECLNVTIEIK